MQEAKRCKVNGPNVRYLNYIVRISDVVQNPNHLGTGRFSKTPKSERSDFGRLLYIQIGRLPFNSQPLMAQAWKLPLTSSKWNPTGPIGNVLNFEALALIMSTSLGICWPNMKSLLSRLQ